MKLPPFQAFLKSVDPQKFNYDLEEMYSSKRAMAETTAFTQKQYDLVVHTSLAITYTLLAQYHQWLNEQLS